MTPGLYVVATPIGNLADMTFRAVETLREAACVLTEDTRHTRILLDHYQLRVPMLSCHKFNEASRTEEILARIRGGEAVALVTDSGMPAVSDPGSRVVAAVRSAGLPVTALPGPSAVTTAVALSGFGGAGFRFTGFLPRRPGARRRRIEEALQAGEPVVIFESPFRLLRLLETLRELAPDRLLFVGRELTKKFEECRWGTPAELLAAYAGRTIKGELVLVLAPAGRSAGEPEEPEDEAGTALEEEA